MQNPTLSQLVSNELHISHSQIFTYLNCSLKYRFQYIENLPQERIRQAEASILAELEDRVRVGFRFGVGLGFALDLGGAAVRPAR